MPSAEPFSRIVRVDALPKEGRTVAIEATGAERKALAALYKLPSIEALRASLTLKRSTRGGVRVKGAIHGELTQICVVTLDPFSAAIDEEIDVRFALTANDDRDGEAGETLSMNEDDEPDPLIDNKIDIGALTAEFFALGIDPYPRKPGVAFDPPREKGARETPFSVLRNGAKSGK
ncbi:MAG TPA: DUF177 domain-containing protein [Roseiarcus sp.]|nr:DUF177 domain-containing protein [Roseiarcus sp.]